MTDKPLVSVIIIFFDAASFIHEAIESLFNQTYRNWELLLVDDGSTDGSTAIAGHYAQVHPGNVRYLEHSGHQNRGMSASRNLGIFHAKGAYIAFLDADDAWLPNKLERQVAIMTSEPEAAMVCGPSQYWYSWSGNPEDIGRDHVNLLGVQPNTLFPPLTLLALSLQKKALTPCPTNVLLRREFVERIGGFEESFVGSYQAYEDQAFLAKVHINGSAFVSSECWDRYRKHPNSFVSIVKKNGLSQTARRFYLNWLEKYLLDQRAKDCEIWEALQSELWPHRHPFLNHLLARLYHPGVANLHFNQCWRGGEPFNNV